MNPNIGGQSVVPPFYLALAAAAPVKRRATTFWFTASFSD